MGKEKKVEGEASNVGKRERQRKLREHYRAQKLEQARQHTGDDKATAEREPSTPSTSSGRVRISMVDSEDEGTNELEYFSLETDDEEESAKAEKKYYDMGIEKEYYDNERVWMIGTRLTISAEDCEKMSMDNKETDITDALR